MDEYRFLKYLLAALSTSWTITKQKLPLFYTCSTPCGKARFGLFQNYVTYLQMSSFRANSSW